jgi:hypothetical protein
MFRFLLLIIIGNGIDNFDAFALLEFDLASLRDTASRRDLQSYERGLITAGERTSYLKLILAEDLGDGPAPKLTLLELSSTLNLTELHADNFDPVLAEPLTVFRVSDLKNPTVPDNIFQSIPKAGDAVWVDITEAITEAIDNASEDTLVLMIQNRDAVQPVGGGTKFYSSNSNFPPTLVIIVDPFTPTGSPIPSASLAPSNEPSGSQTPTLQDSSRPSMPPSTSYKPSIEDSRAPSSAPSNSNAPSATPTVSSAPSGSASPTMIASFSPSLSPSASAAPSASAKPSTVASNAPSIVPFAAAESEFPTNSFCLPCPDDQVLEYSLAKPWPAQSETCGDLRLGLLQNPYFVYDVSSDECAAVVNECGCEAKVSCTPCVEEGNYFDNPAVLVNGVTCQEAQLTLTNEEYAYGAEQCTLLQNTCSCLPPLYVCDICDEGQVIGDPVAIVETSIGSTSCSELGTTGMFGYISKDNCDLLKSEGLPETCECTAVPSASPSLSVQPSQQPST